MRLSAREASRLGIAVTKPSKYRAVKTEGFDSRREYRRWLDLCALERAGEIRDVRRQPEFHCWIGPVRVCRYVADFAWTRPDGTLVVEDVKSAMTRRLPVYRLKRTLVRALFGIDVVEH